MRSGLSRAGSSSNEPSTDLLLQRPRELRNAVERACLLPNHPTLGFDAPPKKEGPVRRGRHRRPVQGRQAEARRRVRPQVPHRPARGARQQHLGRRPRRRHRAHVDLQDDPPPRPRQGRGQPRPVRQRRRRQRRRHEPPPLAAGSSGGSGYGMERGRWCLRGDARRMARGTSFDPLRLARPPGFPAPQLPPGPRNDDSPRWHHPRAPRPVRGFAAPSRWGPRALGFALERGPLAWAPRVDESAERSGGFAVAVADVDSTRARWPGSWRIRHHRRRSQGRTRPWGLRGGSDRRSGPTQAPPTLLMVVKVGSSDDRRKT